MPSIFNHENACWGVKKPLTNLLHCDFIDDSQTIIKPNNDSYPNSPTNFPIDTVKYSVSSNGYYGYQPNNSAKNQLKACDSDSNYSAMDIDIVSPTASQFVENLQDFDDTSLSAIGLQNTNRKRQMPEEILESCKRIRQDAAESPVPVSTPDSHQGEGGGSRKSVLRVQCCHLNENEATAELLRLTHGCEAHLYERSCDY